ncbi:hypothetical protein [Catenuloplanes indicus]|uniref:Uncharacterized protein n=1 Tax=Catenuloplanes indicus TaxID=137267 RepID=A0AAE3VUK0_9ACTN|nr:hypothetical protein [Catenuloplanes indicus]MDQ0364438.1 hypothetical protein [Catenuloplanes indicus]
MAELALLGAELVAVSVLVLALYFPRHRRKDLVVAYFGVNGGDLINDSTVVDVRYSATALRATGAARTPATAGSGR